MHKPSREFKAFFLVLAAIWIATVFVVMVSCMNLLLPDNLTSHVFLYFCGALLLLDGGLVTIVAPLFGLWRYVTSDE